MSLIVNNGIYQKVENDLTTSSGLRDLFDGFWTPEILRANKPLNIDHALPAIIALGLGLIPATLIFLLEVIFYKKMTQNMVIGSVPRPVSRQVPTSYDPNVVALVQNIGK